MKKNIFLLLKGCLLTATALAQITKPAADVRQSAKGLDNTIGLGASFPLGAFNRSHTVGISVDYSKSTRRFGQNTSTYPLIKFAVNAGISYHLGKKITTTGYEFNYGSYFNIYTLAV